MRDQKNKMNFRNFRNRYSEGVLERKILMGLLKSKFSCFLIWLLNRFLILLEPWNLESRLSPYSSNSVTHYFSKERSNVDPDLFKCPFIKN